MARIAVGCIAPSARVAARPRAVAWKSMTTQPRTHTESEATAKPLQVLVAGATGYVGTRLVGELLARGHRVAAMGRSHRRLSARSWSTNEHVRLVEADVLDEVTLSDACAGIDVAYYLVHSMGAGNRSYADDDIRGARIFAQACEAAGVQRIVYLSGLGEEDDDLSEHLRSRHHTGDALRTSSVPVTELRAAIIVGSGSASFEIMRDLAKKLPLMVTPRWVRTRCEPIAIRDVLFYLTAVLDEPRTIGEVLEIGCGQTHRYADMMRITAREYSGRGIAILPVPVLSPRLSSYWLHLVTSVDVSLARELIDGMRNDVVCNDRRITEWIDHECIDLPTAVARAHSVETGGTTPSRWADSRRRVPEPQRDVVPAAAPARGPFRDERTFDSTLAPEELFARVSSIGGENGYGPYQFLWRIRAWIDRAIGGVGFRLGRPDELRPGDALDFWRVQSIEPPRSLVLVAEMRLPGRAELAFTVDPAATGSRLTQRATMERRGIGSYLYWYAVALLHGFVFQSMGRYLAEPPARQPRGITRP
jgi:uncharacterized protein YbjT (DUF2867 family)